MSPAGAARYVGVLLDTSVWSILEAQKKPCDEYARLLKDERLLLAAVTVHEVYYGCLKANWGQRRTDEWVARLRKFPVLALSEDVCQRAALVRVEAARKGHTIQLHDAWMPVQR